MRTRVPRLDDLVGAGDGAHVRPPVRRRVPRFGDLVGAGDGAHVRPPVRRRGLRLGGLILAVAVVGAWWWTRVTPPVTEAEARAYLDRIVAAARAHDFDKVCHLNGAVHNCRVQLRQAGEDAVPPLPPTVVGTRYDREANGSVAGRVLVVEGIDGCGQPYRTEVFVFRENRFHFKAINAVYWSNYAMLYGNVLRPDQGGKPPPARSGGSGGCPSR